MTYGQGYYDCIETNGYYQKGTGYFLNVRNADGWVYITSAGYAHEMGFRLDVFPHNFLVAGTNSKELEQEVVNQTMPKNSLLKVESNFKEIIARKYQEQYAEEGIRLLEEYKEAKQRYETLKSLVDRLENDEDPAKVVDEYRSSKSQFQRAATNALFRQLGGPGTSKGFGTITGPGSF